MVPVDFEQLLFATVHLAKFHPKTLPSAVYGFTDNNIAVF